VVGFILELAKPLKAFLKATRLFFFQKIHAFTTCFLIVAQLIFSKKKPKKIVDGISKKSMHNEEPNKNASER
jgi:hypothetical protein